MRITTTITKWLMGAALASAFVLAAPHKAQAQVAIGIQVGGYPGHTYGYYGTRPVFGWQPHSWNWQPAPVVSWYHDRWYHDRGYQGGYAGHYGWRNGGRHF